MKKRVYFKMLKRKIITTKNKYHNLIEKISELVNKSKTE